MTKYQLMPPLSQDEYDALKTDITVRGVQVPVEFDDQGNVLDGYHRLKACQELGIKDYPSIVRVGLTDAGKIEHALTLNLARRQLTREQRQELAVTLRRTLGWSTRRIAGALRVGKSTVDRDLGTVPNGTVDLPDRIMGNDGKDRPARKPAVVAKTTGEYKQILGALDQMDIEILPDKWLDARRVKRLAREYQAEERASEVNGDVQQGQATLLLGDMRERGSEISDASVDLVFTDPPYPREFLPLWSDLSELTSRVLKPGGLLVTYAGALDLPEVMARLTEHLDYWWCGAIVLDGAHSRVFSRNVVQGSKPLLFYVRSGFKPGEWIEDTFSSEAKQKDMHDWQQSVGAARYYIEKLTLPGALVVDPFMGGGTTGLAAVELGRQFVGIEIDPVAFAAAKERVSNGQIS